MIDYGLKELATKVLQDADGGNYTYFAGAPCQSSNLSALAALGWAALGNQTRAYQELANLVEMRDDQGMIPALAFEYGAHKLDITPSDWGTKTSSDGRRISGIAGLPLGALALRLIYTVFPNKKMAEAFLPHLHASNVFYLTERNFQASQQPILIHPQETTRPSGFEWEASLSNISQDRETAERKLIQYGKDAHWHQFVLANQNQFRVLDPGATAILSMACHNVSEIAEEINEEIMAAESEMLAFSIAASLNARRKEALIPTDDLVYNTSDIYLSSSQALTLLSTSLAAPTLAHLRHHVLDGDLSHPYGLRSLPPSHPSYVSDSPDNGAVDLVATWLTIQGLRFHGEIAAAQTLKNSWLEGITLSQMKPYLDADKYLGLGDGSPALASLVLWEDHEQR